MGKSTEQSINIRPYIIYNSPSIHQFGTGVVVTSFHAI